MKDLVIIGSGPAGITAAIYALRAGLNVTICEANIYGGQCSIIGKIENYPGIESISGPDFSVALYNQAKKLGAEFIFNRAKNVSLKGSEKSVTLDDGMTLACKSVIIANGLKRRRLGCTGEREFSGRGVSYCATCDGSFFKSKKVLIVGGGNTALQDALYLSNICEKVFIVLRKNSFRGESFLVDAVKHRSNIEIRFESVLEEIKGEKIVKGVVLKSKNGIYENLSIDGVFIAIGYEPDNAIYKDQINMDPSGYFIASEDCKTNIPGVYVAGDCRKKPLRQIATAISDGAVAGSKAAQYVFRMKN